ncbi:MAG: beta-carotene 15,15'-monooxygenase [Prevotella sp.]|nr:beta-carotene 15,15'-monooxygenase [Prevotella sp.]
MNRKIAGYAKAHWKGLLSFAFAWMVFLFWGARYFFVLSYQEQSQMLLLTWDYLVARLAAPGGLSCWVGEFLTQFYFLPWIGALLLSLIYVAIQRLTWQLARREGASDGYYPLSFVPVLAVWCCMADEAVLLSFPLSLAVVLALCLLLRQGKSFGKLAVPALFIAVPVVYWLFGTVVYIVALYVAICWTRHARPCWKGMTAGISLLAWTLLTVWMSLFVTVFPFYRLLSGLPYYAFQTVVSWAVLSVMLLTALTPFVLSWLPRRQLKGSFIAALALAVAAIGYKCVAGQYQKESMDVMEYDALVRAERWKAILEKAQTDSHPTEMSVACADLALYNQGMLLTHLGAYRQIGPKGLFLSMETDMLSAITVGEIFYRLGLVNESLRFFYDAQETIPTYNKSARLTARMAEIELVNGQYDVARKYLHLLQKTLFYRHWAEDRLALLGDEQAINSHPVYGFLRKCRLEENSLFQPALMMETLQKLYRHNHDNRMAAEYMQAVMMMAGPSR